MIDKTNEGWSKEIRAARIANDNRCRVARGLVGKMATACFHSSYELEQLEFRGDPVNYVYQYAQTIVPQLVFSNPQIAVTSRRTGLMEALAAANKQCTQRWIQDNHFYRKLREVITDSLFPFGVLMLVQGRDPWPKARRIAQEDFIRDPYALTKDDLRFTGHRWWMDKDRLLERARKYEDEGWDIGLIESLEGDSNDRELEHRKRGNDPDMPQRGELVFYDIVEHGEVMEGYDPELFPSTIYTLVVCGENDDVKEVRKPRPYYGYGPSPYYIYDYGYVPNDTWGLSPIVANYSQAKALNDFWRGTLIAMQNYKNLIAVNSAEPDFAAKVRELGDLSILEVSGVTRDDVHQFSVGGISDQHMVTLEALQQLLDENLGLTEAQKGKVPQDGTATASQLAATSSSIRVDDMEQQVYETTARFLKGIGWHVHNNENLECPLGRDAIREMMQVPELAAQIEAQQMAAIEERASQDPAYALLVDQAMALGNPGLIPMPSIDFIYQGGDGLGAPEHTSFDDLEYMVQPYSMRRTNEDLAQRRALELFQLVAQITQLRAAYPQGARWEELVGALGDQMNHPGLANILLTPQDGGGQAQAAPPQSGPSAASGGGQVPTVGQSSGAELARAYRG